jgi:hypothetical protein
MNWQAIKQLNLLHVGGSVPADILKFAFVKRMVDMDYIRQTDKKTLTKSRSYDPFYTNTLLPKFYQYNEFINRFELDSLNLNESDIQILLQIETDRNAIVQEGRSQKEISAAYFGGAKKLRRNSRLYDAVVKILDVDNLARDEHDQQYLYVLHCASLTPKCIILCENDNKLRKPRLKDVELWHAGGRNTAKLQFIPKPQLPIYYLCDWDNKGIEIYQHIKANIFPQIELLIPQKPYQTSDIKSLWTVHITRDLFSLEALEILDVIMPEKWIEEENIVHPFFSQN